MKVAQRSDNSFAVNYGPRVSHTILLFYAYVGHKKEHKLSSYSIRCFFGWLRFLYGSQWFYESQSLDLMILSTVASWIRLYFPIVFECCHQWIKEKVFLSDCLLSLIFISVTNLRTTATEQGWNCTRVLCMILPLANILFPPLFSWRKEMKERKIITRH